ncbi:ABC-2 type transport system ATP-binding protein [Spiroplasma syrphidicola EA-1]|uniref:ABC-2 type transport system ATP-binding protein n=1 Tax=Spiroplasma syrphidicola EA-1 TaxID=1276229 RepID=R4U4A4_9MOLU|nr:ABC transporter ATP-binding protein [Spiroplasma syrphidicola]AGM26297.1 ABC-2 type transport system ATP-binding protein [Spiroplasma syrphidicola EA-1]
MLKIANLSKKFGNKAILENVNLTLEPDNIYGLLGNNGVGKTTIIKIIFNEINKNNGEIIYNDKNQSNINYKEWFYFTENNELPKNLLVYEYLEIIKDLSGLKKQDFLERLTKSEQILDIKFEKNKKIKNLSAGQQKLLTALSVLILKPKVVFFDEPTANLDLENKKIIVNLIQVLKSNERIIVITTHLIEEVQNILTNVIILNNGEIVYDEPFNAQKENLKKLFEIKVSNTTNQEDIKNLNKVEDYLNE